MMAAFALLAGLLVTTTSAGGGAGDPPSAADQASSPPAYGLRTELEQFVTDQSVHLDSVWAGSRLIGDNHIEVSLTTKRVPPALRRPDITVVQRRHSTAALDRTMEVVTDRLNELLAPGVEPGTKSDWPYAAHLDHDDNSIHVQLVDEARRREAERSLRNEIANGRVRVVDGKAPAQVAAHGKTTRRSRLRRTGSFATPATRWSGGWCLGVHHPGDAPPVDAGAEHR